MAGIQAGVLSFPHQAHQAHQTQEPDPLLNPGTFYKDAGVLVFYYRGAPNPAAFPSLLSRPGQIPQTHVTGSARGPESARPPTSFLEYADPESLQREDDQLLKGFSLNHDLKIFPAPPALINSASATSMPGQTDAFPSVVATHDHETTSLASNPRPAASSPAPYTTGVASSPESAETLISRSWSFFKGYWLQNPKPHLNQPPEDIRLAFEKKSKENKEISEPLKTAFVQWVLNDFHKTNTRLFNQGEAVFEGLVLRIEDPAGIKKAQQFWFINGCLQNRALLDAKGWSDAIVTATTCLGEHGEIQFPAPNIKDGRSRGKELLFKGTKVASFILAILASAKPLPGISSFFISLGMNYYFSWILAAIGSIPSICFYYSNNKKISKSLFTAFFNTSPLETIQRRHQSAANLSIPPYKKTVLANICDALLGFGYAFGNFGLVLATDFLSDIPVLRAAFLVGVLLTNFQVGTNKSSQLTQDWTALLERLFGTRNPALASEKKLLDKALENLRAGLSLYSKKRVSLEKTKLRPNEKELSSETYDSIKKDTNAYICRLRDLGEQLQYPLNHLLKDIVDTLHDIEEDITYMDQEIALAQQAPNMARQGVSDSSLSSIEEGGTDPASRLKAPPDPIQPTSARPSHTTATPNALSPLIQRAPILFKIQDARRKKFTFSAVFSGVNGRWPYLREGLAVLLSVGLSIAGGFSNISGNFTFWTGISSDALRLAWSVFCTLAVFGLNKETFDEHIDFVRKELGHPSLTVGYDKVEPKPLWKRIKAEVQAKPALLIATILSFIQGSSGWYYCSSSHLLNPIARGFAGLATAYAMTTTKIYATYSLGPKYWNLVTKKLTLWCGGQNQEIPIIASHSLTTKFYDELIQTLLQEICENLVEQHNKKLSLKSTRPGNNPGNSWTKPVRQWLRDFAKNQLNMQLSADPELQKTLQIKYIEIQHRNNDLNTYSFEAVVDRVMDQTRMELRILANMEHPGDAAAQEQFYAERIRPELYDSIYQFHENLSTSMQAMDLGLRAYKPGDKQGCPMTKAGSTMPPDPFKRHHLATGGSIAKRNLVSRSEFAERAKSTHPH